MHDYTRSGVGQPTKPPTPFAVYLFDGVGTDGCGANNMAGGIYGSPTANGGLVGSKFGSKSHGRNPNLSPVGLALAFARLSFAGWFYFMPNQTDTPATTGFLTSAPAGVIDATFAETGRTVGVGVNGSIVFTSAAQAADTWHHLAVTWDGATLQTWIDGALADARAASPTGPIDRMRVGGPSTAPFSLLFQDFGFWTVALKPSDIAYLYNSGNGRQTPHHQ